MKSFFLSIVAFFLFISCFKEKKTTTENSNFTISQQVNYQRTGSYLQVRSGKFNYQFDLKKLPCKRVIVLNASLLGFFSELDLESQLVGVASPQYIYSDKIQRLLSEEKILNVGSDQKYEIEKILALKPDLVVTNYISVFQNTYDVLKQNGINLLFLDDYLEQDPLAKSKYLLLIGELFGKQQLAKERYQAIEKNYQQWSKMALNSSVRPVVISNEMYGEQWFVPGGNTQLAHYLKDAGGNYIFGNTKESKAIPMSFEEVFAKSSAATVWVNAGNHGDKKSLLGVQPNYAKMNVFQNGKIYSITGRENGSANDFFESGVVHSDWVLKDYIKILHPELFPNEPLLYMKELN